MNSINRTINDIEEFLSQNREFVPKSIKEIFINIEYAKDMIDSSLLEEIAEGSGVATPIAEPKQKY